MNSKELLESVDCFVPCSHAGRECVKCSRAGENPDCDHNFMCYHADGWDMTCTGIDFDASIQKLVDKIAEVKVVPRAEEVEFEGKSLKVLNGWERIQRILGNEEVIPVNETT